MFRRRQRRKRIYRHVPLRRSTGPLRKWGKQNGWPELADRETGLHIPSGRQNWSSFLRWVARPVWDSSEDERRIQRTLVKQWVWLNCL